MELAIANRRRAPESERAKLRTKQGKRLELELQVRQAWLAGVIRELAIPRELSPEGRRAAELIRSLLVEAQLVTELDAGSRVFDLPDDYPLAHKSAVLVVNGLAGGIGPEHYSIDDRMWEELGKLDLWPEALDSWSTGIYPKEYTGFRIGLHWNNRKN